MSISKLVFSGSTNGRPIKVVQTATAGTLIHTAHATAFDEIWLFATNTDTADITLTIEFGGVTSPDDLIKAIIPAGDLLLVISGVPLSGGLLMRAWAGTASKVNVFGYVNRIS